MHVFLEWNVEATPPKALRTVGPGAFFPYRVALDQPAR